MSCRTVLAAVASGALLTAGCGAAGGGVADAGDDAAPAARTADLGPRDSEFLAALADSGVLPSDATGAARDRAVREGRAWCARLNADGTTREDVARSLARLLRRSEPAEVQRMTTFFGTAARTYCPRAANRLGG